MAKDDKLMQKILVALEVILILIASAYIFGSGDILAVEMFALGILLVLNAAYFFSWQKTAGVRTAAFFFFLLSSLTYFFLLGNLLGPHLFLCGLLILLSVVNGTHLARRRTLNSESTF